MLQLMEAQKRRGDGSNRTDYVPSGSAVVMGEVVSLQNRIGICTSPQGIAVGALGSLELEGVFGIIKDGTSGPVFTKDDEVYWDVANNLAVDAPGSNIVYAGIADEAAGTNSDRVYVDINKLPPKFVVGYTVTTTSTTTT